MVNAMNNHCNS
jgi:hypothetical protein